MTLTKKECYHCGRESRIGMIWSVTMQRWLCRNRAQCDLIYEHLGTL